MFRFARSLNSSNLKNNHNKLVNQNKTVIQIDNKANEQIKIFRKLMIMDSTQVKNRDKTHQTCKVKAIIWIME